MFFPRLLVQLTIVRSPWFSARFLGGFWKGSQNRFWGFFEKKSKKGLFRCHESRERWGIYEGSKLKLQSTRNPFWGSFIAKNGPILTRQMCHISGRDAAKICLKEHHFLVFSENRQKKSYKKGLFGWEI